MDACLCKEHVGMTRSKKKGEKYLNLSTSEERGELLAKTRDRWRKVDKNGELDECCRFLCGLLSNKVKLSCKSFFFLTVIYTLLSFLS